MISRDNFPNSLLRAKSMCAFLYFLFCHSLCPFHLSCVLDKLKVVFGGRHCQTNADRPLTKQGFLVTVAAILDSRNFHIIWGEGWVKQIHCPYELKSCVIFTYYGLKYNYFYNLSKSLGNYWPKYWDKKNWNSFVKYILSLPPSSSSPFTDHYFDPIARLPSLCSAPKEKDTYCVVFIRWFRFSLIEKRIHQSKELEN